FRSVLHHDRHLVGIFFAQIVRDIDTRRGGLEGDVEMMIAEEAALGGLAQHAAHDAAQRFLDHLVVPKRFARHAPSTLFNISRPGESGALLLPGAPRTALT